jgi:predicted RNase H-like nuclease (RuvC/YqgF family)
MSTQQQLKAFARINETRREAEFKADMKYRNALHDYNDALRKAYDEYHNELEQIEKQWQEELTKI